MSGPANVWGDFSVGGAIFYNGLGWKFSVLYKKGQNLLKIWKNHEKFSAKKHFSGRIYFFWWWDGKIIIRVEGDDKG